MAHFRKPATSTDMINHHGITGHRLDKQRLARRHKRKNVGSNHVEFAKVECDLTPHEVR